MNDDTGERAPPGEPAPIVAALTGSVTPGQLETALLASCIVAAADVVFLPAAGAVPRLEGTPSRLVARLGPWAALGFWTSDEEWAARRALRAGLIDRIAKRPRHVAGGLRAAWRRESSAASTVQRLTSANARLGERLARDLERALFSLAFADDRARAGARSFLAGRPRRRR